MTLRGYWILTLAIFCELASITFSSKFLFLFAIFIIALLLVSITNIYFHKTKIHVSREIYPQKPDEDSEILVTLKTKGALSDIVIKDYFDNGKHNAKFFFNRSSKDAQSNAQYKFRAQSRGLYNIGPILVGESDWLGFFSRNNLVNNEENLLVYPKVENIPLPNLPLQASNESSYFDANASSLSEDLFGLKEYTPGDDIRLIHWKTTSRTGKLFVRHHEPISTKSIAIVLDINIDSYDDEEFEQAIRLCASLCHSARSSNKKTEFLVNNEQDMIYNEEIFLDKLCSIQLCDKTIRINELYNLLNNSQSDIFVITGSKSNIDNPKYSTFKICATPTYQAENNHVFYLSSNNIFSDYRQWVEQWNVREVSASH